MRDKNDENFHVKCQMNFGLFVVNCFPQLFCGWICFIFGLVADEFDLNLKFQQICLRFEKILELNLKSWKLFLQWIRLKIHEPCKFAFNFRRLTTAFIEICTICGTLLAYFKLWPYNRFQSFFSYWILANMYLV